MRSCGRFSMETIGSANEMLGAWNLIRDGGGVRNHFIYVCRFTSNK